MAGSSVRRRSGPLAAVVARPIQKFAGRRRPFSFARRGERGRLRPTLCPSGCGKSTLLKSIGGGLHRVEFIVADDPAGLRASLREVLPEAAYPRCYITWAS